MGGKTSGRFLSLEISCITVSGCKGDYSRAKHQIKDNLSTCIYMVNDGSKCGKVVVVSPDYSVPSLACLP